MAGFKRTAAICCEHGSVLQNNEDNFYLTTTGDLYTWGNNAYNQLGTGKNRYETKPLKIFENTAYIRTIRSNPFSQVSVWAAPELSNLYELDLLPPMLWGNYRNNVTRAEFAGLLVNLYEAIKGTDIVYPDRTNFTDIEKNVYNIEIRKAYELDLVDGVSGSRYNPEGRINRQEAAKMICAFIAITENLPQPSGLAELPYYKDAGRIAGWAEPFVEFAYSNNIMQGSNGYFHPTDNLTREQILAMLYRTILQYGWI